MKHFTAAFRNFANFEGRATRTQFWMFFLFAFTLSIVLGILEGVAGLTGLGYLYAALIICPQLAYGARRLHDINRSGWWQLLSLIPVLGPLIMVVMFSMPSKPEAADKYPPQNP